MHNYDGFSQFLYDSYHFGEVVGESITWNFSSQYPLKLRLTIDDAFQANYKNTIKVDSLQNNTLQI